MFLIFDTETTGLPKNFNAPISDVENWPRCVQIAWQLHDSLGNLISHKDFLIKPDGYDIPFQSEKIHGISTALAKQEGEDLKFVLNEFKDAIAQAKFVIGHNIPFDLNIVGCEYFRLSLDNQLASLPILDTCTEKTAQLCQIKGGRGGRFKLPTLTELNQFLFKEKFSEAHNATADVEATTRCFLELIRIKVFSSADLLMDDEQYSSFFASNSNVISPIGLTHLNLKKESDKIKKQLQKEVVVQKVDEDLNLSSLSDISFSHLHNHSQFSILQSSTQVKDLIFQASEMGMPAVALSDIGNMMAAYQFIEEGFRHNMRIDKQIDELLENENKDENAIKSLENKKTLPILGSEFYVCLDRKNKSVKDLGYLIPMLAKNKKGYHNLVKLSSDSHVVGSYYVPRIDKNILVEYKEDIIVSTGGLQGEIPQLILNVGEKQAEEAFLWWKETFAEDFYVELNRHNLEDEKIVNDVLLRFAKKYNVKYYASNNTYYLKKDDSISHDLLLCIKDGEYKSTPIGRGRGFRNGFPNNEFYFKSQQEMKKLFVDIPEAIKTTNEIVSKCESYKLASDVLLPEFEIPEEFKDSKDLKDSSLKNGENNYLKYLTYKGAEKRYEKIDAELEERIDFELETIRKTGYPGYFLIVQDFCNVAREMGVSVGPGRGSAAGSVVAYCTGITNVDPIKYNLLFERFLNPDRVSMPDIDIDFDDEGRAKVIQYVIDKYGSSQVAQIITYGTMAAKSSIRDAGRVLELPLHETDRIAKLVPNIKLNALLDSSDEELKKKINPDQIKMALELKTISTNKKLDGDVVRQAKLVEGTVRNTGIHACGVIITPSDIREFVPVAKAKDSEMWCTQFDNSVAENAGLLKMDFLGLKTLTLIKDTVKIIEARTGEKIDIDSVPLTNEKTYELFQRGETVGVFQYESPGMQKHLKALKPTEFSDLIAMNALYRPGPIEYIPSFIKRKLGLEEIEYDLPDMKEYLEETYGITVYQEQVMLLSQKLVGFTKGEADTLRKAMGKKKFDLLNKMKPKFLDQGEQKGHDREVLEKIWKDWEAFASYAFNKSHSTCYALIAYHTAYLKANYPAEYMASVLSNNMNDIKNVTFFMEECKRMGLAVLGPDVNESWYKFAVNKKGEVRFGLGAIRGVGINPVKNIVDVRKNDGLFTSVFDFVKKVSLRDCNKRVLESFAMAGAFDCFSNTHRAQYFQTDVKERTLVEVAIKYGQSFQERSKSAQVDMFGGADGKLEIPEPIIPACDEWNTYEKLNKEKDVVGIYISGHPLEDYKLELQNFCSINANILSENINQLPEKEFTIIGIANKAVNLQSRKGTRYGVLEIQDMLGSMEFRLFGEQYLKFMHFLVPGNFLSVTGKIQLRPKHYNADGKQKEFNISKIELLKEVLDKNVKTIYLRWDSKQLDKLAIDNIDLVFNNHKGKSPVFFELIDMEDKSNVLLTSRDVMLNVSNELLADLNELPSFLGCSLNKSNLAGYLRSFSENKMEILTEV